jgi:hypothetical protein
MIHPEKIRKKKKKKKKKKKILRIFSGSTIFGKTWWRFCRKIFVKYKNVENFSCKTKYATNQLSFCKKKKVKRTEKLFYFYSKKKKKP